jgi:hypothetical protein
MVGKWYNSAPRPPGAAKPGGSRSPFGREYQPPKLPKISPQRYSIGVDLGQAADYTAIAVLEKTVAPPETAMLSPVGESPSNRLVEGTTVYDLVYLKRPKLGTPYDEIARRVIDLVCELEPRGAFGEIGYLTLVIDGTGVGRGVVDMIRTEYQRRVRSSTSTPKVDIRPATITGSDTTMKPPEEVSGYWRLPKKDLIFPTVAAFQAKPSKIRIARGLNDRDALVNELKNYRRKTNIATGSMQFEPWREADHDDLLFALCLALWGWQQIRRGSTRLLLAQGT